MISFGWSAHNHKFYFVGDSHVYHLLPDLLPVYTTQGQTSSLHIMLDARDQPDIVHRWSPMIRCRWSETDIKDLKCVLIATLLR